MPKNVENLKCNQQVLLHQSTEFGFIYVNWNTGDTQNVGVKKVQTENISEIKLFFLAGLQRPLRLFSAVEDKEPAE